MFFIGGDASEIGLGRTFYLFLKKLTKHKHWWKAVFPECCFRGGRGSLSMKRYTLPLNKSKQTGWKETINIYTPEMLSFHYLIQTQKYIATETWLQMSVHKIPPIYMQCIQRFYVNKPLFFLFFTIRNVLYFLQYVKYLPKTNLYFVVFNAC